MALAEVAICSGVQNITSSMAQLNDGGFVRVHILDKHLTKGRKLE